MGYRKCNPLKLTFLLNFKGGYIEQNKEIKAKYPKKGFKAISNQLNVPKTCLMEWI